MKNLIFLSAALFLMTAALPHKVAASARIAAPSAQLADYSFERVGDDRAQILQEYLQAQDSPLAPYAYNFVNEADRNNIDWRLLVAISGVESTYGKHIPANSYNGWGWGVFGDQTKRFTSWEDAIATISSGIRTNYINRWGSRDVYTIGRYYAASPTWAARVEYNLQQVSDFAKEREATRLSISI